MKKEKEKEKRRKKEEGKRKRERMGVDGLGETENGIMEMNPTPFRG